MTRATSAAPALSIVVPCYNEGENLPLLVGRFRRAIGGRSDVEVVLVDNGSTDQSAVVLQSLLSGDDNRFARVVTVPVNRGYGDGILRGLRESRGDFLAWTHADLQTDPVDVIVAFDLLRSAPGAARSFLKGRRRNRAPFDALFTAAMSAVASVALRARLTDVNAQPKLFARAFLAELADAPSDFSLDLFALWRARRAGYRIVTHDVTFATRHAGEAKGGSSLRGKLRLTRRTLVRIAALAPAAWRAP